MGKSGAREPKSVQGRDTAKRMHKNEKRAGPSGPTPLSNNPVLPGNRCGPDQLLLPLLLLPEAGALRPAPPVFAAREAFGALPPSAPFFPLPPIIFRNRLSGSFGAWAL